MPVSRPLPPSGQFAICILQFAFCTFPMTQKTWGGRFSGATDNRVEAFTESISFDRRLYRHDVRASQAHARMLAEVGLLSADEAEQIAAALDAIAAEIDRGEFAFSIAL